MKKEIILILMFALVFASCNTGKQSGNSGNNNSDSGIVMSPEFIAEHSSRSAVDWAGVYKGMIPCADCEGIDVEIQLNEDNSYKMVMNYLGKNATFNDQGFFEWDETGGKVRFVVEGEGVGNWYRVGENNLLMLDADGNRIENNFPPEIYMLEKIDLDFVLINKNWKLIELNGKEISVNAESGNEVPFLSLTKDNIRVFGNTGCNNLMGYFKVESDYGDKGKLEFLQMVTTRMACRDVNYEQDFLKALEDCNNYSIINDTLSLKKDGELLAKFTGMYLQ
jgi:uncharacterized lipoprotein NlpE involved in copper resistance/heat shock protein HslJ